MANQQPNLDDPEFNRLFSAMFDNRRHISDLMNNFCSPDDLWWRSHRALAENYRRAAVKAGISDPDAYLEDRYRNYCGL